METDRADGFYESCHRMRVRAREKGWRRSFSFLLAFFFLTRLSLDLAKIGEKRGKHRQLIAANVVVPFLKRGPLAKCEHVRPSFCMPACHLRRRTRLVVPRFDLITINLGYSTFFLFNLFFSLQSFLFQNHVD